MTSNRARGILWISMSVILGLMFLPEASGGLLDDWSVDAKSLLSGVLFGLLTIAAFDWCFRCFFMFSKDDYRSDEDA